MFKFLKNNKQYIVIDAGSHKIAATAFQILDNKPLISRIEHHKSKGIKNNQLSDISEFDISDLSYIYSTSNYGLSGTTDELLGISEDDLHEYLGQIGDNNLFFDKDFLDGQGEQLVYAAALNGQAVNMENGVIRFTTVAGINILQIMAYDLGEDSVSIYLILVFFV